MADVQQYSITPNGTVRLFVDRYTIAAQITDSSTGAVLADFTGANALDWPAVMTTLTPQERAAVMDLVAIHLIYLKAGIER